MKNVLHFTTHKFWTDPSFPKTFTHIDLEVQCTSLVDTTITKLINNYISICFCYSLLNTNFNLNNKGFGYFTMYSDYIKYASTAINVRA